MSRPNFTKLAAALTSKTLPAGVLAILAEADGMLTQGESYEATRSLVCEAIKTKLALPDDDYGLWLRDIYNNDQAIYEYDGKSYQIAFSIATTNGTREATLGEPKEVTVAYLPVGESRPGELAVEYVPLVEKALRADGSFPIKFIAPGWGSSGYYAPEILERDGPAAFPAGTKMYLDHPTETEEAERPERSVRDLAATLLSDAKWDAKGADGPGLYADAKAVEVYKPFIDELAPHIGLSIRAAGALGWGEADGKQGPIVERIVSGKSIDFVTEPGAGGKVLQLFESARKRVREPQEANVDEKELATLRESAAKAEALEKELAESRTAVARMQEVTALAEARALVAAQLKETDLPEITQERLIGQLSANPALKEGALDKDALKTTVEEAVKAEAEYLKALGGGSIRGMGSSSAGADDEAREKRRLDHYQRMGLSEAEAKIAVAGR